MGDDHQQVAGPDSATSWCSSPTLGFFSEPTFWGNKREKPQGPDPVFAHGQLYVAMSRVSARHALRVAARVTADEDPVENGVLNVVWTEVLR